MQENEQVRQMKEREEEKRRERLAYEITLDFRVVVEYAIRSGKSVLRRYPRRRAGRRGHAIFLADAPRV